MLFFFLSRPLLLVLFFFCLCYFPVLFQWLKNFLTSFRLDEWVGPENLNLDSLRMPQKGKKGNVIQTIERSEHNFISSIFFFLENTVSVVLRHRDHLKEK